jgi:hypothetical protein
MYMSRMSNEQKTFGSETRALSCVGMVQEGSLVLRMLVWQDGLPWEMVQDSARAKRAFTGIELGSVS